ncbi:hypothetical protein NJC38_07875 [Pseudomonas sp. 21LCFQ010]|uniref:hypothetical protein n=1 Tax=Pseudomonas sp. 21LCFQ010 TaxID=2957506 RepID=UPI002097336B|nr:hypothetical protein [Pseudomonas sp. 21LCFQ010]MCO8162075.1 hypothetical protein [Pseudomonas sp. 21LCFQ010]
MNDSNLLIKKRQCRQTALSIFVAPEHNSTSLHLPLRPTEKTGTMQYVPTPSPRPQLTLLAPTLEWSMIRTAISPAGVKQLVLIHSVFLLLGMIFVAAAFWDDYNEHTTLLLYSCLGVVLMCLLSGALFTQKTKFTYKICACQGTESKQLYFPASTKSIFNWTVNIGALLAVGVAIYTASFLTLLIGAVFLVPQGLRLKNWQPPPAEHYTGLPWSEYNFVTVDRKYAIIVVHVEDPTVGFETRFPNKALFEQYLTFLQTVLPPTAQYTEKIWEW